jgi:hypothetical protein
VDQRLEKLQLLPVREVSLLTTGSESWREFVVPSIDGFWKFSRMKEGDENW